MAQHRLIHRKVATGERSSGLSHLGFRVWVQYMLSADDYGVCPAEATKLQGDNPTLAKETQKRVQAEIENLIAVKLCGVFMDGSRRYLYQPDWQDWQKIQWPTESSYPLIPSKELCECSSSTYELVAKKYKKTHKELPEHSRARNANANAHALANASANANAPLISGEAAPGNWGKVHSSHVNGFCDWVCFPQSVFEDFVRRIRGAGMVEDQARSSVVGWAWSVRQAWAGAIPGDDIFDFWRNEWKKTHGTNRPSNAAIDVTAGLRGA